MVDQIIHDGARQVLLSLEETTETHCPGLFIRILLVFYQKVELQVNVM